MASNQDAIIASLGKIGIKPSKVHWNLSAPVLIEMTLKRGEGRLANNGALVVETGVHTGRSPKDKYIVEEPSSKAKIWWGKVNAPLSEENFEKLLQKVLNHYKGKELFVQDLYGGADPKYQVGVRVVNEDPWHNLFAKTVLVRPEESASSHDFEAEYTILNAPTCEADPKTDGTKSPTFVVVHFARKLILIGGTSYGGEIKKSVFTLLNYLYPQRGIMPMHASANMGQKQGVNLFFGLSGTGKTTLSADPARSLIGDDEHGWSDDGVFNFEGGCYAKCIRLSQEDEPQIYNAIRFGAIVENVVMNAETREIDYNDESLTENTRAAYPLSYIDHAVFPSKGGHAENVIFLTCDAFGVLPPIAKLTTAQAMYHFLSGYTARVAGTEKGVTEPEATFSTCFGAPFMPLHPTVYARMLGKLLETHKANCWLVNTGWVGGPYGVGSRIKIPYTRAMLNSVLDGTLSKVPSYPHPIFGVYVPEICPGVPHEILNPRESWKNKAEYDKKVKEVALAFRKNFEQFESQATPEIKNAAPRV